MGGGARSSALIAIALLALPAAAGAAESFDSAREANNYAKGAEREQYETGTPEFEALQSRYGLQARQKLLKDLASDGERAPANLCGAVFQEDACLGDVRLWDFAPDHGIRHPILFTARSGATLSGNVWATRDGPAKRPAVVFITGSVQVPEPGYWFVPTVLAKRGYVVITFDEQGEGLSDTLGEPPDLTESVPAQGGQPFYDGAEDALDFLLSTPDHPYMPRASCSTGTVHSAKQERRVKRGLNAAYNPLWEMVDREHIGMAGQSLGASAASYVGQADPRVDAIVGLDNLRSSQSGAGGIGAGIKCDSAPDTRKPVKPTKPGLGISNDYFIVPVRYTATPGPLTKAGASYAYSDAGADSAQINIRGGTHLECAYVPLVAIRATLRGYQICGWYLAAWMDKYLKRDPTADRRLLSTRWLHDERDAQIDPQEKGNLLSYYFNSRIDVHLTAGGNHAVCETVRTGCEWLTGEDAWPGSFDINALAHTPDGAGGPDAYEPRLRDGMALIAERTSLRGHARRKAVAVSASAAGNNAADVRRFELQERQNRRWVRRGSVSAGKSRSFRTRSRRVRRFRARAIDRLGGAGPWSRSVRIRAR